MRDVCRATLPKMQYRFLFGEACQRSRKRGVAADRRERDAGPNAELHIQLSPAGRGRRNATPQDCAFASDPKTTPVHVLQSLRSPRPIAGSEARSIAAFPRRNNRPSIAIRFFSPLPADGRVETLRIRAAVHSPDRESLRMLSAGDRVEIADRGHTGHANGDSR